MRTIIAAYHDRYNAEAATEDLSAAGRETTFVQVIDDQQAGSQLVDALVEQEVPRDRAELYAEAVRRGSVLLMARAPDHEVDHIVAIFDRHQSLDIERAATRWRSQGWTGYETNAAMLDEETRKQERELLQRESLDVIEEDVRVGKREQAGPGVRVRTYVTERPVREEVRLREERIGVTREAVDEPVPPSATDSTFTEQEYVVTTTSEEPVVQKEAHVVERVNVEKEAETRTEAIEETERRREVAVEPVEPVEPRPRH